MPARQAQGRPWGCGGGVTVLDAVERCGACMSCAWCNRARTRIEIRSPTSPRCLKRCNCKLRRPCHDRFKLCSVSRPSSLRSEGSCSVAVTCVSCECVRPSSLVLVLAGPNLSRVFEPARPSTMPSTSSDTCTLLCGFPHLRSLCMGPSHSGRRPSNLGCVRVLQVCVGPQRPKSQNPSMSSLTFRTRNVIHDTATAVCRLEAAYLPRYPSYWIRNSVPFEGV